MSEILNFNSRMAHSFHTSTLSAFGIKRRDAGPKIKCTLVIKSFLQGKLNGEVLAVFLEPTHVQGAEIQVIGRGKCSFTLEKSKCGIICLYGKNTTVERNEMFFSTTTDLVTLSEFCSETQKLYRFSLDWPESLPGTYRAEFGSISYQAFIRIRTSANDIFTHDQPIIVKFKRDLRKEPNLLNDRTTHVSKKLFLTRHLGKISIETWLPIVGYATGQTVPVLCTINNESEMHFGGLIFVLTRINLYKSKTPVTVVKTVRTDVCRVARMADIHRGKYEFFALLKINENEMPTLEYKNCKALSVSYEVWVCVEGAVLLKPEKVRPKRIFTETISAVVGTEPILNFDGNHLTDIVLKNIYEKTFVNPYIVSSAAELMQIYDEAVDDDIIDKQMSDDAIANLKRQFN